MSIGIAYMERSFVAQPHFQTAPAPQIICNPPIPAVRNIRRDGFSWWEAVIRFGIRSARKCCSRQAESDHILSRRSPPWDRSY
jgi:hypothetical protein